MILPLIVRPPAEADIREVREGYDAVRPGLGAQFAARVRAVLERIEAMPELYGVVWKDVRAVRLRPFRHVLYYVVFADRVEVLAVMHGARDPSAWQQRA